MSDAGQSSVTPSGETDESDLDRATGVTEGVSLADASAETGVSISALRKWITAGHLPSAHKVAGLRGQEYRVSVDEVRARQTRYTPPPPPTPTSRAPVAPPGDESTVIVPLDAWQAMLAQIGSLHEAGQLLGDARERAAKAETEATFLRDRVRELRSEIDELRGPVKDTPAAPPAAPEPARRRWLFGRR